MKVRIRRLNKSNRKLRRITSKKESINMGDMAIRPCSPMESLKESLIEMNLMRNNKQPKRNLNSFLDELEREIQNQK